MLVLLVQSQSCVSILVYVFCHSKFLIMFIYRKHLIVSIGSECYVTLPKGQIIPTHSEDYTAQVPGGGHVLIVPITHYPTFSTIPSDIAKPIIDETER